MSYNIGHRFDSINHNWLILREYLSLSFSYMTFVIKENIEEVGANYNEDIFDHEPYNYLFNRRTAFMDGEFVRSDHNQLQNILTRMYDVDPDFIEQLSYLENVRKYNVVDEMN